jgi:hypothetical protein
MAIIKVYHGTNEQIGYGILRTGCYVSKERSTAEFYGKDVYEIDVEESDTFKCQYDFELPNEINIDSYKTKKPFRILSLSPTNGIL